MANYEIGTLLLKLGYENEEQFEAKLSDIEQNIGAADAAGKRFYDSSRQGYRELAGLAGRGADELAELTLAFGENRIGAHQFADGVAKLVRIQQLAERAGGKLGDSLRGIADAEEYAAEQVEDVAQSFAQFQNRVEDVRKAMQTGSKTAREMRTEIAELGREAQTLSQRFGSVVPPEFGTSQERLSKVGGAAARMQDVDDIDTAEKLNNYLRETRGEFALTGELDRYTAKLERLIDTGVRLRFGVEDLTAESAFYSDTLRTATGELEKLDRAASDDVVALFENRLKRLNAELDSGRIELVEYRQALAELRLDSLAAAESFDKATGARARLEAVSARSKLKLDELDTESIEAGIGELENRFKSLQARFADGQIDAAEYRRELALLADEARSAATAFEENSKSRTRLESVAGRSTSEVEKLDTAASASEISTLENRLKSLNSGWDDAKLGAAEYREELEKLAQEAREEEAAFEVGSAERAKLDRVAGTATTQVDKLDTRATEENINRLENQFKSLEGRYATGKIGLSEYKAELESLVLVASRAADEFGEASKERARLDSLGGRAQNALTKANISADTQADLKRYSDRLVIIDSLHRAGVTNTRQFQKEITELGNDAMQAASKFDHLSDEYQQYVRIAGQAGSGKKRVTDESLRSSYFSKEFILGNALSNVYGELGIRLLDFVASGVQGMQAVAIETERAKNAGQDLLTVSQQQGADFAQLQSTVDAVAEKYYTLATNGEAAAASLLGAGFSTQQTAQLLDAVGASAVQNGTSVKEAFAGIANAGTDVEGAITEATGSSEAYQRALVAAAGGQEDLVTGLSQAERQAALFNATISSSERALRNYGSSTNEIRDASLAQVGAVEEMQAAWGDELGPTVLRTTRLLTGATGVLTSMAGPIGNASDLVAAFAGHFSSDEMALIGFATASPAVLSFLTQVPGLLTAIAGGFATVSAFLGPVGWAVLAAGGAAALIAYLSDGKTASEALAGSLAQLDTKTPAAAAALEQLKNATGDDGLKGAVTALAGTIDTEAGQAFTDFADDAISSAETTAGAIALIYEELARNRTQALEDTLADVQAELGPLLTQQQATDDFQATGDGGQLKSVQAEKSQLEAELASLQSQQTNNLDNDAFFDNLERIGVIEDRLRGLSQEATRLSEQGALFGAAVNDADAAATAARVTELQKTETRLQGRINALQQTPTQAVNREFGLRKDGTNPNPPPRGAGNGAGGEDPAADLRGQLEVAKAQYALLQAEYGRDDSDAAFKAMNDAGQEVLDTTEALIGKLGALGSASSQQQVELINLKGEAAGLFATLADSPNVLREQNAAEWVEGLGAKMESGALQGFEAMELLRQARERLDKEIEALGPVELMDPDQKRQLESLQRIVKNVRDGSKKAKAKDEEQREESSYAGAAKRYKALMLEGARIPDGVIDVLKTRDTFDSAYVDDYNKAIDEADKNAQELAKTQALVALGPREANFQQNISGQPVTPVQNQFDLINEARTAALAINTPEAQAYAQQLAGELTLLKDLVVEEQAYNTARNQRSAARNVVAAANGPVQSFSKSEDQTELERAQQRFNTLRSALDGLEPGDAGIPMLTEALSAAGQRLDYLTAAAENNAAQFGDGGIAYTVGLARREYGSFSEAVKGLNLTMNSTGPLMDALRKAYFPEEMTESITQWGELSTAIRKVEEAQQGGRRPPQWALDLLQGEGYRPQQLVLESFAPVSQNIENANEAIAEFERGLKSSAETESALLSSSEALKGEMDTLADAEVFDQESFDAAKAKLAEVLALYTKLRSKRVSLEFVVEQAQQEGVGDDAAIAQLRARAEELKGEMAGLDTTTEDGKAAWLVYNNELEGTQGQMDGLTSTAAVLSTGLGEVAGVLRGGGDDEAATAFELLSGAFSGLDKVLKGGTMTDSIKAIGEAFKQSEDEGLQAMGNLLVGAGTLAAGIASGDPSSIIGGALSLLTGLIDIFTAGAKALAAALKEVEDYEKGFKIVNPEGAMTVKDPAQMTVEERHEALDADNDGRLSYDEARYGEIKPEVVENEPLIAAFESLEGAMKSLLKEKIMAYIETGNLDGFREGVEDAVTEALVEGFLATAVFQDILGDPLNNYVKVSQDPNATPEAKANAEAELTAAIGKAENAMIDLGDTLKKNEEEKGWEPEVFDVGGSLGSSLMSVDFAVGDTQSLEDFREKFGNDLRDYIKKQLIEAFLVSAAIKPLLDELGVYLGEALADGVISDAEQRKIDAYIDGVVAKTDPLMKSLAGLSEDDAFKVQVDNAGLAELNRMYEERLDPAYLEQQQQELENQKLLNNQLLIQLKIANQILAIRQQEIRAKAAASPSGVPVGADAEEFLGNDAAIKDNNALIADVEQDNDLLDKELESLPEKQRREQGELTVKIKAELGIDQPSIKSDLASAFSADSYSDFLNDFGASLKEMITNALLESFLTSGPMAKAIEQLSNESFNYLQDGVITSDEKNRLMVLGQNISNLGEEYYEMLEAAGLLIPDFGGMDLPSLYDDRSQGALDEIQSRLGATADDFGSTLAGAFDTDNLEDFRAKLKAGVKDSIRQAMIAAFLESAAIKPLLDALSQGVLDAMADGTLSADEKDYLLGLQASLGIASEEFFGVLDELGLGFSDLNESLGEVNESLTNVPQGFRIKIFTVESTLQRLWTEEPGCSRGNPSKRQRSTTHP